MNRFGRSANGIVEAAARCVRYRFFLSAGVLPYLLGAAVAWREGAPVDLGVLALGILGVVCVGVGIEGLNEYFDARRGGDRVFAGRQRESRRWHLPVGLSGFALALAVAVYLACLRGAPVLAFAAVGGLVALSYLTPPMHLSYRGLGELAIAMGYGPGLTVGSYYLHSGQMDWPAAGAALLPMLLLGALALANEIPDYYGDRLVGKRNLVVRTGPRGGARLYGVVLGVFFGMIAIGGASGLYPRPLMLILLLLPWAMRCMRQAVRHCREPVRAVGVIRETIGLFLLAHVIAIAGYVSG